MTAKVRPRTPAERAKLLEAVAARVKNASPKQRAAVERRRKAARNALVRAPSES